MIERERSYKFIGDFKQVTEGKTKLEISQWYILLQGNMQVRVRRAMYPSGVVTWEVGFKSSISKTDRIEIEQEITYEAAKQLLSTTLPMVSKTRYILSLTKVQKVYLDAFENGLNKVEVEYIGESPEIPDFCGEEVTENKEFSNINMALNNKVLTTWID